MTLEMLATSLNITTSKSIHKKEKKKKVGRIVVEVLTVFCQTLHPAFQQWSQGELLLVFFRILALKPTKESPITDFYQPHNS